LDTNVTEQFFNEGVYLSSAKAKSKVLSELRAQKLIRETAHTERCGLPDKEVGFAMAHDRI
jgi:hypothetical protein